MSRAWYTVLLALLAGPLWAVMRWRAWRTRTEWAVWSAERFGRRAPHVPRLARAPVWVHAVSVGETRAAAPLIHALLAQGECVLLTHTTPTGRQTGQALYAKAIEQGRLQQAWMPYDFAGCWRRFLAGYAPRLGVLIEREVWPNMVAACRTAGVPMALVSARLSARGAARSSRLGRVLREAYGALDVVCAQSEDDASRLRAVGCRHVVVCGNLKFDVLLDAAQIQAGRAWREALGRPVIVLASTREGEDRELIRAVQNVLQGEAGAASPLIVWVPRHAPRFDDVAASVAQAGLSIERRSHLGTAWPAPSTRVYLGDTLGEMAFYYGAADVAVIGGSFAPLGAQNFIEACAAGVPVILGPSVYNFQEAARDALAQGLVVQVTDAQAALAQAGTWVLDPAHRAQFATRAQVWLGQHVGATSRILAHLPWPPSACARTQIAAD